MRIVGVFLLLLATAAVAEEREVPFVLIDVGEGLGVLERKVALPLGERVFLRGAGCLGNELNV